MSNEVSTIRSAVVIRKRALELATEIGVRPDGSVQLSVGAPLDVAGILRNLLGREPLPGEVEQLHRDFSESLRRLYRASSGSAW